MQPYYPCLQGAQPVLPLTNSVFETPYPYLPFWPTVPSGPPFGQGQVNGFPCMQHEYHNAEKMGFNSLPPGGVPVLQNQNKFVCANHHNHGNAEEVSQCNKFHYDREWHQHEQKMADKRLQMADKQLEYLKYAEKMCRKKNVS